jgi:hypothetical protein
MRQTRVMKLNINPGDENYLLPDIVSIALAYFLNLPHPSLKCVIQFLFIQTPHNLLQALKKTVFIGHLNPLEFFVRSMKQVEITGAKSDSQSSCDMRLMPCSSSQFVEARLM